MAYQTNHLDTIVRCARLAAKALAISNEAALVEALDSVDDTCFGITSTRDRKGEWTAEQVDEYRELAGVVRDVRNGFVSPSIGNVRDYVMARI